MDIPGDFWKGGCLLLQTPHVCRKTIFGGSPKVGMVSEHNQSHSAPPPPPPPKRIQNESPPSRKQNQTVAKCFFANEASGHDFVQDSVSLCVFSLLVEGGGSWGGGGGGPGTSSWVLCWSQGMRNGMTFPFSTIPDLLSFKGFPGFTLGQSLLSHQLCLQRTPPGVSYGNPPETPWWFHFDPYPTWCVLFQFLLLGVLRGMFRADLKPAMQCTRTVHLLDSPLDAFQSVFVESTPKSQKTRFGQGTPHH